MQFNIDTTDLETKLHKILIGLKTTNAEKCKRMIAKTAHKTVARAKYYCPVGTPASTGKKGYRGGNLRASIHEEISANGFSAIIGAGGPSAPYAIFVEFGTCKMGARPFLRTGFLEALQGILDEYK
jgi:HK97 gp10 family phage protein